MFSIFPYIFTNTFNAIARNSDFIDNIVNSVLNSEFVNDMVENLENIGATPTIEFRENNNGYAINADLPGIKKDDILLDYNNNYITLTIKRNVVCKQQGNVTMAVVSSNNNIVKDYYVENVDPYKIQAVFKDGKLNVNIPKKTYYSNNGTTIIDVDDYTDK